MPKVKGWGNFGSDEAKAEGGSFYSGDVPPKGAYRTKLKVFRLKLNSNGDHMLSACLEVAEPKKSSKAKYNGYGIWWNGNVTKQGAGFVNSFLDAAGFDRKKFWAGQIVLDDDGDGEKFLGTINKIGTRKVSDDIELITVGKLSTYQGNTDLKGQSFAPVNESDDEDEDESEEDFDNDDDDDDDDEDEDDVPF